MATIKQIKTPDGITHDIIDTNTHYTTGITAGASGTTSNSATSNPYIKIKDDSTHRSQIQIKGAGSTSVNSDASGVITITSTDTNTDTKVTSVGNHYSPSADANSALSANADSTTSATWGTTDLVTGVSIERDAKGHVTGMTVSSVQMPANPNTDTHWTSGLITGASATAKSNAAVTTNGNVYLNLVENDTVRHSHNIVGSGSVTVTSDANGKITIKGTDNNTKNTAGSTDSSSKLFLIGATAQDTNPQTYSHDTAYVGKDGCLYSGSKKVATEEYVSSTFSTAMVFKGTLGVGGTITSLPTAETNTIGDTYKVITAGTYASIAAKVGDVFVCNSTPAWILIPSGDEPNGTVTNIATGAGLTGGSITTSGTIKANLTNETKATVDSTYSQGTDANKLYSVQLDKSGKLAVKVPWTDTTYTSLKNPYSLTIQGNGATLSNGTYDGSAAKTVNITPSAIGAAPASHEQSASTITSGVLLAERGGTGNDINEYPDGAVLVKNTASNGNAYVDYHSQLPVVCGGTGNDLSSYPDGAFLCKQTTSSGISFIDYYSNPMGVANGGTGITVNPSMRINLESDSTDTVFKASSTPGVSGVLGLEHGGTNSGEDLANASPGAFIVKKETSAGVGYLGVRTHISLYAADDQVTGVLGAANGGTGNNISSYPDGVFLCKQTDSNGKAFVDYYSKPLSVANGGTGKTSAAEAIKNISSQSIETGANGITKLVVNGIDYAMTSTEYDELIALT